MRTNGRGGQQNAPRRARSTPPLLSRSPAPLAAAALAAALLFASPTSVDAKVVLAKPETKKVFQGEKAAPRAPTAPKAKKAAGGGAGAAVLPSLGNAGTLALPAALLAVGGGLVAAQSVDPRFAEVLDKGSLRDSNEYAGYEVRAQEKGGSVGVCAAPGGDGRKNERKRRRRRRRPTSTPLSSLSLAGRPQVGQHSHVVRRRAQGGAQEEKVRGERDRGRAEKRRERFSMLKSESTPPRAKRTQRTLFLFLISTCAMVAESPCLARFLSFCVRAAANECGKERRAVDQSKRRFFLGALDLAQRSHARAHVRRREGCSRFT